MLYQDPSKLAYRHVTLHVLESLGWPAPEPEALARSEALVRRLRAKLADSGGSVPFATYMHAVLYEPGLGYYAAHVGGFARHGDFVTAPELSPVFAHCLTHEVAGVLAALGPRAQVLELGAGSGALAEGVLRGLVRLGQVPAAYRILEVSAHLQLVQRARLIPIAHELGISVEWLSELPAVPFDGVILANEVVDALPVDRFQIAPDGPLPVHIAHDGLAFHAVAGPKSRRLSQWVDGLEMRLGYRFERGYCSETSPWTSQWISALGAALGRGVALLFDYGYEEREYYHPERTDGTLLCHYRHRAHGNPFLLPGLQDVTASVDFSALAGAAERGGFEVAGYTTQAWFLIANDLERFMNERVGNNAEYYALASAVRALTLPGEMGERVKVMALSKGAKPSLKGFAARDLIGRL